MAGTLNYSICSLGSSDQNCCHGNQLFHIIWIYTDSAQIPTDSIRENQLIIRVNHYMRIGFDLDKVFIDYPPIVPDKIIDKLYKKKANGLLLYRIPSRPEQILRRLSHLTFLRPPIYENISFLKSIPKDKHKLYLISSRYNFLKKTTEDLLKRHEFDKVFDGHYFNFENRQPHLFKAQTLKKLKIDVYVDDDLHLLKHVAKENPNTKFYWLTPTATGEKLPKNIKPISRLSDILPSKL